MSIGARELSAADKREVFKRATSALPERFALAEGLSDEELVSALEAVLGIFGGSCGPNRLSVCHQAAGLKIWGGWHIVNHVQEQPLFAGRSTVAMARDIYGIFDTNNPQLKLI